MQNKSFIAVMCLLLGAMSLSAQTVKIKVACVGNSLTGFHQYNYYATPLQAMLGDGYLVDNFGKGGSGVFKGFREELNENEWSYINSGQCKEAVEFNPDIVIIKFGANDANMKNFTKDGIDGKRVFMDDYALLVNKFRALPSSPKVFICVPPAMFYGEDGFLGGGFSNKAMRDYIQPAVKELAAELGIGLIDLYTPTKDHPEFMPGDSGSGMPDWVHPDHQGHYLMALQSYKAIMGKKFKRPRVAGEFVPKASKVYCIRNCQSGLVLDCDTTNANRTVGLAAFEPGRASQLFKFENFSYDIYRIRHIQSNIQLKNDGQSVVLNREPGNDPKKFGFYITPIDNNGYTLSIGANGWLGVAGATVVGDKSADSADQWEFVEVKGSSSKK